MPAKRHLTAEARRERTVETVIALCARDEPATLTTGEIARQMGVTQGALFRHFPSKDAIWEAVVDWVGTRVMQRVDAAAARADTPLEALEAMFMAHVAFIAEHPGVPRLLLGQLQHARPTPARRMVRSLLFRYRERIAGLLEQARATGELREGLDLEAATMQFIGTIQGLVIQSLMAGEVTGTLDQAPRVFAIYRHGIAADGEART
ncbi:MULTISPECIES: TetR/AcrR family transcriptional regulator [Halomonas]|uniref:TetR/AcrR family transcriptional regulator n=1 Tax=Halomonas flagellata TaxID=2920385 RepID=A0ABS9RT49_9GAMM|nr:MULTISPECIES: TetR/AcrR family transcriptional regulator [Halomonas]MCH4563028.1 TetR/AcrR family transcriptional regulator [Halomonas flagellata]PXX96393.1 TetR family transcriptional regulator [Halomonas sp. LBP4]